MKVECLYTDWHNAYGSKNVKLELGEELTVVQERYVGGAMFYIFEEYPEDHWFLSTGFRSIARTLH